MTPPELCFLWPAASACINAQALRLSLITDLASDQALYILKKGKATADKAPGRGISHLKFSSEIS